ncbi:hypothetical protein GCM10022252_64850 [Streptosporangium oxazolinicum]|uniref:Uncharacterized protein n=1 Tax=Streptosporangium oxazolinicum TaxID=909287 RepID=A0ABP8BEK8_9ACTN
MSDGPPRLTANDPHRAAELLRHALREEGIVSDVHGGHGLALVSVWTGLVVGCDGELFWWRTGWDPRRYRFTYSRHPAMDPQRAAYRIASRYTNLRETHPLPEPMAELRGDPV